jgi:hypothetical protein
LNQGGSSSKSAKNKRCVCGGYHDYVNCWALNQLGAPEGKRAGRRRIEAAKEALRKDPEKERAIREVLRKAGKTFSPAWTTESLDDGNPPTDDPAVYTICLRNIPAPRAEQSQSDQEEDSEKSAKPGGIFNAMATATSLGMENRWILDPGSNVHIINTEDWPGWRRQYDEVRNRVVSAGDGFVAIEAWGSMEIVC